MSDKKEREKRREQRVLEETDVQAQERRKRLVQFVSGAVFLALAVVLALIVINGQGSGGDTKLEDVGVVKSQLKGIPQEGMVLGDPGAKVALIEFGDLQCPVCKGFSEEVIPEVIDSKVRSGKAKIEFRNFTIISEESVPAGAAAIAAGEQGRGWNFVELFYRNQGAERSGYVTDEFLTSIARGAGVKDIGTWNKDRKSKRVLAEVSKSTEEAQSLGFEGTPSFAVHGPGTSGLETLGFPESSGEIEEAIDRAQ